MQSSEVRRSRKALAALVGFLTRDHASCRASEIVPRSGQVQLIRDDGASRKVDVKLFKLALRQGLIAAERQPEATFSCSATVEGRSALRRWLADPESAFQDQHRTLATRSDPDHGQVQVNQAESPLTALARIKGRSGALFLEPLQ